MKKIGILTTGGDCSGLNMTIWRIMRGAHLRGWRVFGVLDGTDGLVSSPVRAIELNDDVLPIEYAHIAGSFLRNGHAGALNFETAAHTGSLVAFNKKLYNSIRELKLDVIILIGGNGSLSLAWANREIYRDVQLICIPKTIDMDIPLTDRTIGFDTAVEQLTRYCDQLILTARSHHRWFVVQSMGRDCGALALNAGIAAGASAILIPEIKFDVNSLVQHIKNSPNDYGIIMVAEGISLRGHSGRAADMISRALNNARIPNRTAFPEHIQRAGDTTASDRLLATAMADTALNAIDNNETYVMTALQNGTVKTVSLSEFANSGESVTDPHIPKMFTSNAYVAADDPLLEIAHDMGVYIGEVK